MIIVVKDRLGNLIEEIENISTGDFVKTISENSNSSFQIDVNNRSFNADVMKESNRFFAYESGEIVYTGFFNGFQSSNDQVTVSLSDQGIWSKKIILADKTFTVGTTISEIVTNIFDEINSLQDTGITLDCIATSTITDEKKYSAGVSFLSILKDLALSGYEFTTHNDVLTFKESVGIDRTQDNSDYFEAYYNKFSPQGNNVKEIESILPSNVYNVIIAKNLDGVSHTETDSASIDAYGRSEKFISVDGDLQTVAETELEKSKNPTNQINISPVLENFNDLSLGDLILADITTTNDLLNYRGDAKILEKRFTLGEQNEFIVKASSTGRQIDTFLQRINKIEKNLNKLLTN
jgi:hypothetical protein